MIKENYFLITKEELCLLALSNCNFKASLQKGFWQLSEVHDSCFLNFMITLDQKSACWLNYFSVHFQSHQSSSTSSVLQQLPARYDSYFFWKFWIHKNGWPSHELKRAKRNPRWPALISVSCAAFVSENYFLSQTEILPLPLVCNTHLRRAHLSAFVCKKERIP